MSAPQPPAFYPDPADPTLERWWDGQQWGSATQPRAAATPAAAVTNRPRRTWKKRATVGIATLAALYLAGIGCNAIIASDDDPAPTTAEQATTSQARAVDAANDRAEYDAKVRNVAAELACKEAVEERLKAPDSATYRNVTSIPQDDGSIVTAGTVTATNTLGGASSHSFACSTLGGRTVINNLN